MVQTLYKNQPSDQQVFVSNGALSRLSLSVWKGLWKTWVTLVFCKSKSSRPRICWPLIWTVPVLEWGHILCGPEYKQHLGMLAVFVLQERAIHSVCWNLGMTDCWPTPSTRASIQSGTKSSVCQFVSVFFSLVTPCVEDCNKLKFTVVPMGQIVTNMWSACFCVQPRQRYSRRSGGDRLWWGWRQGARLPWKSRRSSALGTR